MTKAAFTDDGWFCTGDIGHLEEGRFLMVTDRKKEIFKLEFSKKFTQAKGQAKKRIKKEKSLTSALFYGRHKVINK